MSWGERSCSQEKAPKDEYGGCSYATIERCNHLCPYYTWDGETPTEAERIQNFKPGDRVMHEEYGECLYIREMDEEDEKHTIIKIGQCMLRLVDISDIKPIPQTYPGQWTDKTGTWRPLAPWETEEAEKHVGELVKYGDNIYNLKMASIPSKLIKVGKEEHCQFRIDNNCYKFIAVKIAEPQAPEKQYMSPDEAKEFANCPGRQVRHESSHCHIPWKYTNEEKYGFCLPINGYHWRDIKLDKDGNPYATEPQEFLKEYLK